MLLNEVLTNKVVDNTMTINFTLGYWIIKRTVLIRTSSAYNLIVMTNISFPLGMAII
ncbi:MAG: hypothetical protein ACFFHV_08220 [Promethearchaeota archaeon]